MDPMARYHPDTGTYLSRLDHLGRYMFASRFVILPGNLVLDVACGTGYGSHYLAEREDANVIGFDVDEEAIAYARQTFKHPRVTYHDWDITETPWPWKVDAFDLVTAFEVLEHLADPAPLLSEVGRILAHRGVLVISTPDRASNPPGVERRTEYHVREYEDDEFLALLRPHFAHIGLYSQTINLASNFYPLNTPVPLLHPVIYLPYAIPAGQVQQARLPWSVLVAVCTNDPAIRVTDAGRVVIGAHPSSST